MSSFLNLYLDTRDATDPSNPANCTWVLPHSFRINAITFLEMESIILPNIIYPVRAGVNDTFIFQENGTNTDLEVTLTQQNYSGAQIATELALQMNTQANTYLVSYDSQTKKLTITLSAGTSFRVRSGNANTSTGFLSSDTFETVSKVATNPVNLSGTDYIEVVAGNISLGNYASNGRHNVLALTHIDVPFGSIFTYQNKTSNKQKFNASDFSSLDLRIYDAEGSLLVYPSNMNISYHLKLSF